MHSHAEFFIEHPMTTERWLPIEGFEQYEVSDLGRVRRGNRIKQPRADKKGYLSVALWKNQKAKKFQVSRLVAAAFIGPRPSGQVVRHGSGGNTLNHAGNLCYGTHKENEADKIVHGTKLLGENHPLAKLTAMQAMEIRRRYKAGSPVDGGLAMAREFGIHSSIVTRIVQRKIWKEI